MIRRRLLSCVLVLFASACSTLDSTSLSRLNSTLPGRDASQDVLHQASRIKNMSPAELSSEADSLQKAFASRRSEDNRLRLALFLALAAPPQGDRTRALSLLDLAPNESNGRGRTHPLAQLLLPLLQDNRRLEQDNRRLDEALATSQQKQRELQQAHDAMRQKLEAISDIEIKMQERPKAR